MEPDFEEVSCSMHRSPWPLCWDGWQALCKGGARRLSRHVAAHGFLALLHKALQPWGTQAGQATTSSTFFPEVCSQLIC